MVRRDPPGLDLNDRAALVRLAVEGGISGLEAERLLANDEGRDEVLREEGRYRSLGVNGVPSFFLNGTPAFSGIVSPPLLASDPAGDFIPHCLTNPAPHIGVIEWGTSPGDTIMSFQLPQLRIGKSLTCNSLTVFPLHAEATKLVEYELADEAIAASTVAVQEVSAGGSVPELLVENTGACRVLFLEGEELRGAKQNRVLNTSILVPAKVEIKVPVSCVEQGRWRYTSKHFGSAKTRSPHSTHYAMKSSVTRSLREDSSHRSDQSAVWQEVQKTQAAFGFSSPTSAMSDTYEGLADKMTDYREKLKYPEGAVGVAIAVGKKVVCVDLFDKPATCQKAWDRLLSGSIVDALEGAAEGQVDSQAVEQVLAESRATAWTEAPTVGEGQEFRAEFNGNVGSALMLDGAVVHMNVLTAPEK